MDPGLSRLEIALLAWLYYHPRTDVSQLRRVAAKADGQGSLRDLADEELARATTRDGGEAIAALSHLASTGHVSQVHGTSRLTSLGRAVAYAHLEGLALQASSVWLKAVSEQLGSGLVVDIGGGTGQLLDIVLRETQSGLVIDIDRESLVLGRGEAAKNVAFVAGDAHRLPLRDGVAVAAVSRITFMYLDEARAFVEVARVLAPRGRLLLFNSGPGYITHLIRGIRQVRSLTYAGFLIANTALYALSGNTVKVSGRTDHLQLRARTMALARSSGFTLVETGRSQVSYASSGAYYLILEKR